MNILYLVLCAGIVAYCTASERNTPAIVDSGVLISDTLDLLVNGSQAGVMTGSLVVDENVISTQQTVSVNQNGQNVVNLLEQRYYNSGSGGLARAYQKMSSPSGSSVWELVSKKGFWELTVVTAGVSNTRTIKSVHERINGTLGLYKGIKCKSFRTGDSWTDTLIELTSGENIYAAQSLSTVSSGSSKLLSI